MLYFLLLLLLVFGVFSNLLATVSIIKSELLTRFQIIGQIILVWVVPYLGARMVLNMLSESEISSVRWIPKFLRNFYFDANNRVRVLHDGQVDESEFNEASGGGGSDGGSSD